MMKTFGKSDDLNRIKTADYDVTLFSLFLPIFIELVLRNLMSTVNVLILGSYSDNVVASVGVATQLINMIVMFFNVVSIGATVIISQSLGAGNREYASKVAAVSIVLTSSSALIAGVIFTVFAPQCMKLMQLEDKLLPDAITFFRVVVSFIFFQAALVSLSAVCRSYGKTKVSMVVTLVMNALNAIGNYIVVYQPFKIPFTGVSGVAASRVVSELIALLIMIILVRRMKLGLNFRSLIPIPFKTIKNILRIGIPSGVESISYSISQTVSTGIIAVLGAVTISSKIYVQNIVFFVYILGLALGQATALMIGRLVGAGEYEKAYRLNIRNLKIAVSMNIFMSLIVIVFRYQLIKLFTNDAEIIELSAAILAIDIFVEAFRAFNHIEQNSLRGAGDVKFPMVISVTSCWLISILFSYILGVVLGLGLFGCWIAFAFDEMFRGVILFFRWRSRKWTEKTIVKISKRNVSLA